MARTFVGVGSNIEPEKNLREAVRLLARCTTIRAISTVYRTEPIGPPGQPAYCNCVLEIDTDLQPLDLKQNVLRGVETTLGRSRTNDRYAPRTIDLDLILYDDILMRANTLTLPDPDIAKRPYLVCSLAELAPDLILPGTGERISELAAPLINAAGEPLEDYTDTIRKELLHERESDED